MFNSPQVLFFRESKLICLFSLWFAIPLTIWCQPITSSSRCGTHIQRTTKGSSATTTLQNSKASLTILKEVCTALLPLINQPCSHVMSPTEVSEYLVSGQMEMVRGLSHFVPYIDSCNYCDFEFDAIIDLEEFKEEIQSIAVNLNITVSR